uniref:ParM/StbA family protein n=1 Tax=Polaromonas sp. UBA4122 TaxID=1947074 RepID=UPI0025ED6CF5
MTKVLAVDVGFGNLKAVWDRPDAAQPKAFQSWKDICFKSVAHPVVVNEVGSGMEGTDRVVVTVGNQSYYVGPQATVGAGVRALHEDYIATGDYEALLTGAWSYMFKETQLLTQSVDVLVLGLPVSRYQATRKRLKEIGSKIRRVPVPYNMRERSQKEYVDVVARQVIVLPQPYGGLRLASEEKKNYDLFDDGVVSLVIDPGYNTFDWFVANGMKPQLDLCGSFGGGVSQILRKVAAMISSDHGVETPNFSTVETALVAGSMNLGFKRIDMEPYRATATNEARSSVAEFLQLFNPTKNHVAKIYICGGGAHFYACLLYTS